MIMCKDFFTDTEWDLIYSLVANNREFCEDEEHDPIETYNSVMDKIHTLWQDNPETRIL